MSKKLTLSITLTSALCLSTAFMAIGTATESYASEKTTKHGGKCAAGKCGTDKRFAKKELADDPQDRLSCARDGKCGLSGRGVGYSDENGFSVSSSKITSGVCGQ